jgi:hypothetical protein
MDTNQGTFREWAANFRAIEAYEFSYYPSFTMPFGAALCKTSNGDLYGSMWIYRRVPPTYISVSHNSYEELNAKSHTSVLGDLDPIAWRVLQETLERTRFWTDKEWEERHGRDGSDWYFEGLKEHRYLSRQIWSPNRDDPAYELGRFFFSLVPSDFAFVVYDEHSRQRFEGVAQTKGFPTIFVY